MSEAKWEEEREKLLENLRKANQVAAESQAEAAVYRDLLEDCYRAANQALQDEDLKLLYTITGKLSFGWMPSKSEVKQWGKYFLNAYMRDAGWLEYTKKALEQIKADAQKLLENNEIDDDIKRKLQGILAAAEDGLITHV